MTKLVMLPFLGLATASGGLVGSNYVFKKTINVDLEQNGNDGQWDLKLKLLIPKLTSDNKLKAKINTGQNSKDNLATTSGSSSVDFTTKNEARADLKKWCLKKEKEEHEKAHEEELCKVPKKVNWLFE